MRVLIALILLACVAGFAYLGHEATRLVAGVEAIQSGMAPLPPKLLEELRLLRGAEAEQSRALARAVGTMHPVPPAGRAPR